MDNEYTFERLEDRSVNYVSICSFLDTDCSVKDGEYSIIISDVIGALTIDARGTDDIDLLREAFLEHCEQHLTKPGNYEFILKESGEWEDVFWHKYYILDRWCCLDD